METLQPLLIDSAMPGKTYEETIRERLIALTDIYNETVDIFLKRKPFYSQIVFDQIELLFKLVRNEIAEVRPQAENVVYWGKRKATAKEFIRLIDSVCDAIRERINRE